MAKASHQVSIRNGAARAVLYPESGRFDIAAGRGETPRLARATAGVTVSGETDGTLALLDCDLVSFKSAPDCVKGVYRGGGVTLDISIAAAPRPGAFVIELAVTNKTRRVIPVKALLPVCSDDRTRLELGFSDRAVRIYRNGWYSWDTSRVTGLLEPHGECAADDSFLETGEPVTLRGLVRSAGMTQVRARGAYFTAGFLSQARQFGMLSFAARDGGKSPVFSAAALADGKPVAPGRRYRAEPLYVSISDDYNAALADYASLAGETMLARRFPQVPAGWCSWYYYYGDVSEEECLANLGWLAERRHGLDLRVFQVDAGWQKATGDWLDRNDKFPRGMKALADDIRAAGFTPGLWYAPFMADPASRLAAEHPDWLVANDDGGARAMPHAGGATAFALDLTNPRVLGHLAEVTSRICWDWGYDYIKIDFLHFGAAKGGKKDDTKTRAQNLRRGLEVIRQAAGPEKYILGCGCPLGPAVGIVDGMRVSEDVAPRWRGPLSVLASSRALTRNWMHGLLWHNDPDCLILRKADTELSQREVETLANMVVLSGGALMLSDRLPDLPSERLAMLDKLFPAPTTASVPLDLYKENPPAVYFAAGDRILLGVFNWGEKPRLFKINPRQILRGLPVTSMTDFWRGGKHQIPRGALSLDLAPHESKLLLFE